MKKLIILFLFFPLLSFSQLTDNFNDGDFTQNPVWTGNDTSFVIEIFQLRSNGPQGVNNIIYLGTPNSLMNNIEWSFLIDLKFNPTSTNFVRVYLTSNQADLSTASDAYYIEIGQTNQDNIKLYKKNNNISTLLFTGNSSFANNVKARIKVTRDISANWNVFSDISGGYNYISEGSSFNDNSITNTSAFGFYCQYSTPTRFNQYYFDDVSIGNIVVDTIAPTLISAIIQNNNGLDILFSEEVDNLSSQDVTNYIVDNGFVYPQSATKDINNKSLIHLTFSQNFIPNTNYQLDVSNVADLKGNIMLPSTKIFSFYESKPFDIVINEIMTDQNPVSPGLPVADYIELYNRSSQTINLNNWKIKLKDDASYLTIGNISLLPDSFLILTPTADIAALSPYSSNIFGFTSFAINIETSISLADASGKIMHNINFNKSWYNDVNKQEGGWSLEQIDPNNPCGESANWRASVDSKGGTPGKRNSVNSQNPDLIPPYISKICVLDKYSLKVSFNEKMSTKNLLNTIAYQINHNLLINNIAYAAGELNAVILTLNDSIQDQLVYTITVTDTLTDCAGNSIKINTNGKFAFPSLSLKNEVIINEILFNPKDDGVDFVEIYNRSLKNIDLKKLYIAGFDLNTNKLKSMYPLSLDCGTLFSGEYMILTTNPTKVKQQYVSESPLNFIAMPSMPSFNNDMGIVVLCLLDSSVIDRFDYNETMHFPLLTSVEGVSLERINPEKSSQDKLNWHSASQSSGFATPAYKNSQYSEFLYLEDPFTISPEIFSPDNDGYNDILNINYQFGTSGYVANVSIFDAKGRLIRQIVKNELLGTRGSFTWDGIDENRQKAIIGIYIIYIEVFDLNGNVKTYKKSAVLGGKF